MHSRTGVWFAAVLAGAVTLAGCGSDLSPTAATKSPLAFSRFVNAVADSGASDWRFIDAIENSPVAFGLNFRQTFPGAGYQATGAGSRHLRIFQTSTDIQQTQKVLFDTTFTFDEGVHYTIVAAGNLRAGSATPAKLYIIKDDFSDPGTSIAVRVLNAGAAPSADVYASASGGSTPLPSSPLTAGVAAFTASPYKTMSVGPLALRLTSSGSTSVLVDAAAPAGAPADKANNLTAVGGSTQAGSAFTAIFFPAAVAGSRSAGSAACTTKCSTPGFVYIVDRYPPPGF
jgi:uncharacterized protein DUF4397